MTFTAPGREQNFVLKHIADIGELATHDQFAGASEDMVEAIVEGREPSGLSLEKLVKGVSVGWEEQREKFGFSGR